MRAALGIVLTLLLAAPASAQSSATYRCADGTVIPVEFHNAPRAVSVQVDGKSLLLPRKLFSVQGARYAKDGISLRVGRNIFGMKRKGHRWMTCSAI